MPEATTFQQFYEQDLTGIMTPLEAERKSAVWRLVLAILFSILALVIFVAGPEDSVTAKIIAFLVFVPGVVCLVMYAQKRNRYISEFKQKVVRKIIEFIDPSLTYSPKECISQANYQNSGLYLRKVDNYEGDDYVEGKREKTAFCFCELHTEEKVSSGKTQHMETIFHGLFFIGDFNKNFSGRTYVWSESDPQLNFFNKLFSSFASGLERVKLESVEFEKDFIVYSDDQVESRYILTPSFMERIMKLKGLMGEGLSLSFVNSSIYVAVPIEGDMFEPSVFSPNSFRQLGDYYKTVHIVFEIIDELQLNDRLWNKD